MKQILIVLFSICLLGCEVKENLEPGVYFSDKTIAFSDMSDDSALVEVNGEKITKADLVTYSLLLENLHRLRMKKPLTDSYNQKEVVESFYPILMQMIQNKLIEQYARKVDAVPDAKDVVNAEQDFVKSLGVTGNTSFDQVCSGFFASDRKLFEKIPFNQVRDIIARQTVVSNSLTSVSDEELNARKRFVEEFDANADKLNAESRAKLLRVRAKMLSSKKSFADITNSKAEISPEHGSSWIEGPLSDFEHEENLIAWLKEAKVGEISQPIDLQDGLALVKLENIKQGEDEKIYKVVKCTVKAYENMTYQDQDAMTKQLLKWKNEEAQKILLEKLIKEAVLEYTNGTNFFPNVQK